jgi:hypothetical protein
MFISTRHLHSTRFLSGIDGRVGRLARSNHGVRVRQSNPTGKLFPIYRNVQVPGPKYFASVIPKYLLYPPRPILSTRGVSRSLRTLGWDAVDAEVPIANGVDAYGKDVWS